MGKNATTPKGVVMRLLAELRHPPENELLYRPIREDDPATQELRDSIAEHGVKDALLISKDNYIISGNRRATAARMAGLVKVPCRVEPITRDDPRFLTLLREMNRQRLKSPEEQAREAVIDASPREAYEEIVQYRKARARSAGLDELAIDIRGEAKRCKISAAKMPMLEAAIKVMAECADFWPLTLRQVHYWLLNDPPLKHARKPGSRYVNDELSYKDLSKLLIRARIEGLVSWDAIDDPTRPIEVWDVHASIASFVKRDAEDFLKGYWRDRQQGQPLHLEIVGEKNTIANIIRPLAEEYCIPMTLGRGYCSGSPRKKLTERFRRSGRDRLVLLVLSDFDPEGEDIAHSFARSVRDEFGLDRDAVKLVKVALTDKQVEFLKLPPKTLAKERSSRRREFVDRCGEAVHELEAVQPTELQAMLRAAVETVMDVPAYNRQVEYEEQDVLTLKRMREAAMASILPMVRDA